jgi:hypothetical protein
MAKDEEELKKLIELAEYIRARMESEERPGLFSAEEMARYAIEGRKRRMGGYTRSWDLIG